jgi:hypothetical protein
MVTIDSLRMTTVKVFDAYAHTIYMTKILWAKKYVKVKDHSV